MKSDTQITSESDFESVLQDSTTTGPELKRRNSCGPKYHCSYAGCDAIFKRMDQLDRHEYHHTGIKKYACSRENCDRIYTNLTHLKRHLRTTHERKQLDGVTQKTIKCTVLECNKMFTTVCNMQRHVRESHEHPREYICEHCEAKFTQKLKLRRHEIRQHTKNYPFNCPKCSKGFFQLWQRDSHERSCKLYSCSNCAMQFDKWTLYLKHCRETQHGRKQNKCQYCDRSYSKPSELKNHITAKHSDEDGNSSIGGAGSSNNYKCTEPGCNKIYSYERNLRQHVLTSHVGRKFECLAIDCGRQFSSAQNLAKHMQRDHSEAAAASVESKSTSSSTPPVTKLIIRKKRKDAGKPTKSHLAKLSSITLDKDIDKLVRVRKSHALQTVEKTLQKLQQQEQAESDKAIDETAVDGEDHLM